MEDKIRAIGFLDLDTVMEKIWEYRVRKKKIIRITEHIWGLIS